MSRRLILRSARRCGWLGGRRRNDPAGWTVTAVVIAALVLFALAAALNPSNTTTSNNKPILGISGARGSLGYSLTNRESVPLTKCDIRVLDQGSAEWYAALPGALAPSETVSVSWAAFKQNEQSMPAYIGRARNNIIVSCLVGDDVAARGCISN